MVALLFAAALSTIPFRWTPGQIEVEVSVNGRAPVWFIVDTGAEYSILARSLADSLALKTASRAGREFARGISVRIGPIVLRDQDVMVMPLQNFKNQGRNIVGVVGYDFFNRYVVTINYDAHTLELQEPRSFRSPPDAITVPLTFSDRLAVVPLTVNVADRAPIQARVIVDTGASEAVVLRHPFAEKNGLLAVARNPNSHLNIEGRSLTFSRLTVQSLEFAGSSFRSLNAAVYATPVGAGGYTNTDGALGNEILRHFRVTLDYSRKQLLLVSDVREVFERLNDAGLRRDVAALEQLYAEDYFHTNPDGSIMRRAEVLASYRKPATMKVDAVTHTDDIWQIHGDTAVVNTRLTTRSAAGERQFRVTYVFEKRGGRWQAVNSHATIIVGGERPSRPQSPGVSPGD